MSELKKKINENLKLLGEAETIDSVIDVPNIKTKYKKAYKFLDNVLISSTFERYGERVYEPLIVGDHVDIKEAEEAFKYLQRYL